MKIKIGSSNRNWGCYKETGRNYLNENLKNLICVKDIQSFECMKHSMDCKKKDNTHSPVSSV